MPKSKDRLVKALQYSGFTLLWLLGGFLLLFFIVILRILAADVSILAALAVWTGMMLLGAAILGALDA